MPWKHWWKSTRRSLQVRHTLDFRLDCPMFWTASIMSMQTVRKDRKRFVFSSEGSSCCRQKRCWSFDDYTLVRYSRGVYVKSISKDDFAKEIRKFWFKVLGDKKSISLSVIYIVYLRSSNSLPSHFPISTIICYGQVHWAMLVVLKTLKETINASSNHTVSCVHNMSRQIIESAGLKLSTT